MPSDYLHGFSQKEQERLVKQAQFLEDSIYKNIDFTQCANLLELGCGVGAQTEILLRRFPRLKITSIDASQTQLEKARERVTDPRVTFKIEDAKKLTFSPGSFDGIFVCWLLEHVPKPIEVLREANRVLKSGGKIYCSEVLNASLYLHPYSPATLRYWFAYSDHQWTIVGDPFVGAKLGNLLLGSGYSKIDVQPIVFHYDNHTPKQRSEMFQYWSDLLLSGTDALVAAGKVDMDGVLAMKAELETLKSAPDSVFFYSAIQASATKV